MKTKLEWVGNNPIVTLSGEISFDELYEVDGQIFGDSRFEFSRYVVYNFLEVIDLEISIQELKIISVLDKSASRWNENIRVACLVQDEGISKTISKYFAFMEDSSWETESFSTRKEALAWCKA